MEEQQYPSVDKSFKSGWFYYHRFSILPNLRVRQADQYNTWGFNFHWLVFRAWTIMSPDIGFEVTLDDQQLQIRLKFPYLITGFFIPLFPASWSQKIWWTVKRDYK